MSGDDSRFLGVVTGLAAEHRLIAGYRALPQGVYACCAGADSARAERMAEDLVTDGASALMSFGMAGALDPELSPGDLVLSESVLATDGRRYAADATWCQAVAQRLAGAAESLRRGTILGTAEILPSAEAKAAAFATTGCLAADMESHAVATVAARHGIPFLALRAIADTADDALPAFVTTAVKPNGETAVLKTLATLAIRPWLLPAALRLSQRSNRALASLERATRVPEALFRGGG